MERRKRPQLQQLTAERSLWSFVETPPSTLSTSHSLIYFEYAYFVVHNVCEFLLHYNSSVVTVILRPAEVDAWKTHMLLPANETPVLCFLRAFSNYFSRLSIFIRPKRCFASGEYWKYPTGQKNGVDAFGYNSGESEPIWMTSGTMCEPDVGAGPDRFWARSAQYDSLRGSRNFVFFCHPNNARFDFTDFPSD